MLTVSIFGVLLVKSANSPKIKQNIGAMQHITCRLIRYCIIEHPRTQDIDGGVP
jgi:hypothetical protein